MKALNRITLVSMVVLAIACQTTKAQKQASPLRIETFTANEAGFLVNSHLIEGETEAVLVDAQFTRSQAKKVVDLVLESQKKLTTIFITHGHPDHYLGLEVIKKAFPNAKIVAAAGTIEDIKKTAQGKIDYWKKLYGDDLADTFTVPSLVASSQLLVDGQEVDLIDLLPGESENATLLYVPSAKALITGDLAYNNVHLWLAEDRPESWLKNLNLAKKVGVIESVLPGHGEDGGKSLLDVNAKYIETFLSVTKNAKTKELGVAEMKKRYPTYRLPVILELSVAARIK